MWRTNAIIMALTPKECNLLFNGSMSMLVRKSMPKKLSFPFKVYVYQKKHKGGKAIINEVLNNVYGGGKVVGEFVCDKKVTYSYEVIACAKFEVNGAYVKEENRYNAGACLSEEEMYEYSNGKPLYGWHITEPKLYDKPKELELFWSVRCTNKKGDCQTCEVKPACINNITRPPQSWCYIEEIEELTDEERIERLENNLKEALSRWRAMEKQLSQERLSAENVELLSKFKKVWFTELKRRQAHLAELKGGRE